MLRQIIKSAVSAVVRAKAGWMSLILCLSSAVLLALPFCNGKFWFLAWIGFIPLFILLENKTKTRAFLFSYFTGAIFWSLTIYWLIHVTLIGTAILVLYLALYFGIFGLFFVHFYRRFAAGFRLFAVTAGLWVILEYIRGALFTGFPWALLGYSQYLNLSVIQISDLTGAWGVSFLIIMVNVSVKEAIGCSRQSKKAFFLPALILILSLGYGYCRLNLRPPASSPQLVRVSVVQGNIPQELKWNVASRDFIIKKYLDISRQASKDNPDLIIWPEAALPVVLEEEPAYFSSVKDLARETKTALLLGAVTARDGFYYNSAVLVSAEGELQGRYNKLHLVPFGEYIPLRKVFTFLETVAPIGDIEKGKGHTVFAAPAKFSALICFEDLFPEISRKFAKSGAGFLVNITNDAWYKKTSAALQHFQASVFRAVENRMPLVRCANTGISGFIGPDGKIISLIRDKWGRDIFVSGYDTQAIAASSGKLSFYSRFGDIFPAICLLFVIYGIVKNN